MDWNGGRVYFRLRSGIKKKKNNPLLKNLTQQKHLLFSTKTPSVLAEFSSYLNGSSVVSVTNRYCASPNPRRLLHLAIRKKISVMIPNQTNAVKFWYPSRGISSPSGVSLKAHQFFGVVRLIYLAYVIHLQYKLKR